VLLLIMMLWGFMHGAAACAFFIHSFIHSLSPPANYVGRRPLRFAAVV